MNVFLDDLPAISSSVGYGRLGLSGRLGYEDKPVVFNNAMVDHAISAHAPSKVEYSLKQEYSRFTALVGINEDIPGNARTGARFIVLGDGRELQRAVVNNQTEQGTIDIDVSTVTTLTLVVEPERFEHCHTVWVSPLLWPKNRTELVDCLGRTAIDLSRAEDVFQLQAPRAIVTICSTGFEDWLDHMLASLQLVGGCKDYPRIVLLVDADDAVERVARKHNAHVVYGRSVTPRNPGLKSALYSVGRLFPNIDRFLCLDVDMILHAPVVKIFDMLDVAPSNGIAVCRDLGNRPTLLGALEKSYKSSGEEFDRAFGIGREILAFPFVINDGIYAASGESLRLVDATMRNWPRANDWSYANPKCGWRNQFVFNLAIAATCEPLPLDPAFNVQLHKMNVVWGDDVPYWNSRPAKILHFSGQSKNNSIAKLNRRLPAAR